MWSQDYLAAPWTTEDLFTQLHTNLTDPLAGWTLYEDERLAATYPYVIYRNNLGTGRDVLLYIDVTQSTNGVNWVTLRSFMFETAAYTPSSAIIPDNTVYQAGTDLELNTNLLINHANTPNRKNMIFWFEQGSTRLVETTLFSIEPYVLSDGVTLMNDGDDGSSYPLWVSHYLNWSANSIKNGALFERTSGNFSVYFDAPYSYGQYPQRYTNLYNALTNNNKVAGNYVVESLFFKAARAPEADVYTTTCRAAHHSAVLVSTGTYGSVLTLPSKRIDAWSGGAAFVEAFRPEIITGQFNSGSLHVDPRGYLGEPGDILIARSFGGSLGDSFTVNSNNYRIVYSVNEGTTSANMLNVELAMRVS